MLTTNGRENHQNLPLFQSTDGPLVWPEKWKGDIKAIPVLMLITDSQSEVDAWCAKYSS